jgi:tRNA A58 N-methylase Trm61
MWILFLIGFIFLGSLAYASHAGAPWVPTWKKDFERIIKLANLKSGETFIELGCGNGRVCRAVAARSDARVIGVELSLLQYLIAQLQVKLSGLKNIQMKLGNAFHQDLSKMDVVYMFFLPETYEKIRGKLEKELKPGARVIAYVWPIEGWKPIAIDELEGQPKIYLYQR